MKLINCNKLKIPKKVCLIIIIRIINIKNHNKKLVLEKKMYCVRVFS